MKNDTCVYFHKRLDTNEVFYVGIGSPKRPYSKNDRNKWWHNIANKVGYEVEVIEENLTWDSACLIEIALISFFGRRDLGKGTLVNLTDGGDGMKGRTPSEETKAKLSAALKGKKRSEETKAKISESLKGKKRSEETKAKISKSSIGKKMSAEARANMSAAQKGKKHSEEARAKISKAHQGEKGSKAKLTDDIVTEIIYKCKFHYYHGILRDLAKQYGVHKSTIFAIKNNAEWKHISRDSILLKEGDTPTSSALTDEIVTEILYQCEFHYYRGMGNDLAKKYGVHRDTISNIKRNKTFKHIDRNSIIKKT